MTAGLRKSNAALVSVLSNTVLVVGKLVAGAAIGSISVLSEAAHSAVDLMAALIAFVSVRRAERPADPGHPFGHGKLENISGAVEALLIFVAAGWIIVEAVHKLRHPTPLQETGLGLAVMATSAGTNWLVSRYLFRVGKETDSVALLADAWHLRTDVYTSVGVVLGLAAIALGRRFVPHLQLAWVDPVVAIAVALLIVKAAHDLTREAVRDLLDASLPQQEQDWIRERLWQAAPVVRSIHRLRTRKAGATRFVDFHLVVDPAMTVETSHRLSHELAAQIRAHFADASVIAHVEPCDGTCAPACQAGCLLPLDQRPVRAAGGRAEGSLPGERAET